MEAFTEGVNVGPDCWNMIKQYYFQLEHREKYLSVMRQIRNTVDHNTISRHFSFLRYGKNKVHYYINTLGTLIVIKKPRVCYDEMYGVEFDSMFVLSEMP